MPLNYVTDRKRRLFPMSNFPNLSIANIRKIQSKTQYVFCDCKLCCCDNVKFCLTPHLHSPYHIFHIVLNAPLVRTPVYCF